LEFVIAIILTFLETTFIIVVLLLIHGVRNQIGKVPFYLCIGGLFIFMQIISATELKVMMGYQGADFYISNSVLFMPLLAAVMLVYITEGTLAMQRLIIGIVISFAVYIYLGYLTSVQCTWRGFSISQGATAASIEYLLDQTLRNMTGSTLALIADLFLLPIIFQRLRNIGARIFFSVLGALIADTLIAITVVCWDDSQWSQLTSSYAAKALIAVWISLLVSIYLKRIEREIPGEGKGSLDVLFAFLGSYGMTKALKKDITEWEDRYRVVIESASDIIFIADVNGKILDANPSAVETLKASKIKGRLFSEFVDDISVLPELWQKLWEDSERKSQKTRDSIFVANKQLTLSSCENEKIEVDVAFSKTYMHNNPVFIIVCRNITEQNKLKREKEELTNQLYHTQRLDSIGKLAGGVAHEFNNIIHAIQGHIDFILLFNKIEDEEVIKHLESANAMVGKAGTITSQLLGFARKSKYIEKSVELGETLMHTHDMFMPLTRKTLTMTVSKPNFPCMVKGNSIQLQQVFLNILINAMDALEQVERKEKIIEVKLSRSNSFPEDWKPLKIDAKPEDYYKVSIRDNGIGMEDSVRKRIFEPFYTTKEVGKGTGMGLALVYGEISGYNGFIHVVSQPGVGSVFYIYLPVLKTPES
jgi:PAS domain S-box-containing protein